MSERLDERTDEWPLRPWIMAAICAAGGLIFHYLLDHNYSAPLAVWRQAGATFVAVATVSFVMTVEKQRLLWAVGFALGWGLVIALIGWFTASYNYNPTIFEWPYLSGILAVLIAAPLFQTIRDEGKRSLPYERLHGHAWADAVIGAASLFFTGITFLLSWLIAGLFDLIGIEAVKHLLEKEWFAWMLAGAAFGAAVGLLRERDRLLPVLQRVLRIVLAVLAPPLAVALALFLLSIPFTGLEKFWKSGVPATPLLLLAGAGSILLANTIFGESRESRSANIVLRWSALALVAVVLPLAIIAAMSIGARIGEYGWTPERIWGVIAVAVAIAYGLVGWYTIIRARLNFDEPLRPLQTALAISLCGLALFLALPILDFGAISARSQLARLESGKITPDKFDWTAMAFDFGPAGRRHLADIARSGAPGQRNLAKAALDTKERYLVTSEIETTTTEAEIDKWMRVLPEGAAVPPALRKEVVSDSTCHGKSCVLLFVSPTEALLIGHPYAADRIVVTRFTVQKTGGWSQASDGGEPWPDNKADPRTAPVEVRNVTRRQVFVDGKPVGQPFE